MANIELTPEKPEYPGGVWHIEGMENENIVASGIYYYTSENISASLLGFRAAVRSPDYEQDDHHGVDVIYNLRNEQPLNQYWGSVITKEDRCIVFPNIFQHKVAPFKLEDPSKPGRRKILVFFLVGPSPVISTATVPPQQLDWLKSQVQSQPSSEFPNELSEKILDLLDWPLSLEEAKKHREELMKERKFFVKQNNELLFERPFSLCEH